MNNYSEDLYNLDRFVEAQEPVYDRVCCEVAQGFKKTHWMWFVFPQITGLSSSPTSRKFSISSLDEATAYLSHLILGPRLIECTNLVNNVTGKTINEILGSIDSLKFRSSMTLFSHATIENQLFKEALQKYFSGQYDQLTLDRL